MILSYSKPEFKGLILGGDKIHTLREDKSDRWKPGMSIQHWLGNPRNVSKNPHQFHEGVMQNWQAVKVFRSDWGSEGFAVAIKIKPNEHFTKDQFLNNDSVVHESIVLFTGAMLQMFCHNDGLTKMDFKNWFLSENESWLGKILHFTPNIYKVIPTLGVHFAAPFPV